MSLVSLELDAFHDQISELCRRCGIAELSVFGSVARGEDRPDSDVDLLYVSASDSESSLWELWDLRDELAQLLGRKVDLVPKTARTGRSETTCSPRPGSCMPRDNLRYLAEIVEAIDQISRWLGEIDKNGWDSAPILHHRVVAGLAFGDSLNATTKHAVSPGPVVQRGLGRSHALVERACDCHSDPGDRRPVLPTPSPTPGTTTAWTTSVTSAGRVTGQRRGHHGPNRGFLRALAALA